MQYKICSLVSIHPQGSESVKDCHWRDST